jgi:endonuclease YncB( thermonuclease family)
MVSIIRLVFRAFSSGPRKVKRIAASPVKVIDTSQKDTEHPLAKVLQVIDGDTVDVKSGVMG